MSSTATTNTLEITVAASPITTAAILDAVKGTGEKKQQVKQLKNKMEKTKKILIENTNLSFTTVNEIYSQATLLLQSAISPENNSSEKELSCSVENFVNCIETTCGSIEKSVALLKKLKQKMVQTNKTYIEQINLLASLPVPEESTQAPPAKKPRAKKVKEIQPTEESPVIESSEQIVAAKTKKPRAKKVKETQPTEESPVIESSEQTVQEEPVVAAKTKKPRAKKVKETQPTEESPVIESSEQTLALEPVVAEKSKKPRAKKVKETKEIQPTEQSPVVESSEQTVQEEPVVPEKSKKPRAKKPKSTTTETLSDKNEIDVTITVEETQQPQTDIKYTVIYPEESQQEPVEQKPKKTKHPKQSKKQSDLPSTPVTNDIDSITAVPSAPIKENTTRESLCDIPQDDFIPKKLTFDDEINSQDFCKELDMITDELEEDTISEITEWLVK
jgi:hypothetical protein